MPESISIIIPAHDCAEHLRQCLNAIGNSTAQPYECIVVDDGSTDKTPEIALKAGAQLIRTEVCGGPAHARNLGAAKASGTLLFFLDADVCVHPETIERMSRAFEDDPLADAVIGSYDSDPACPEFLSQYRNLMHCYTHQEGKHEASTFWSGCGAIRRSVFLEHSGFEESYKRPAIEDIELGYRLRQAGCRLILDRNILCKHLKRWTLGNLVKTDVFDRAIPWTELILRDSCMPNDLNLQLSHRVSTAMAFILVAISATGAVMYGAEFLLPVLIPLLLVLCTYWVELAERRTHKVWAVLLIAGGVTTAMAYAADQLWIVPLLCAAFLLLLVRHRYSMSKRRWKRIAGLLWAMYAGLFVIALVVYFPHHHMVFAAYTALLLLMIINSHFYVFLASRLGYLYALASIPFHLLFHFYNGVSFIVGSIHHFGRAAGIHRPWRRSSPVAHKR